MITYCTGCAAPLGTTDALCPTCGAAATLQRTPTAVTTGTPGTTGRQPILGPITGGTTSTGAAAAPSSIPSRTTAMPVVGAVPKPGRSGGPVATGTITGPVTCDQITATGTGQRLLAFAVGLIVTVALATLATLIVLGGVLTWYSVLVSLLPVLLILVAVLLLLRMTPFGWLIPFGFRRRRRRGSSGRLVTGAAKGLTRIVVAPMRAGSSLERELSTEVRRFRVTEVSGRHVDCELVGKLTRAQLQQGDMVDVFGRTTRHGTVRVRAVVVTSNQARITARPHLGFVLARIANVVAVTLLLVCVIAVGYLLLTR